MSQGKTAQNVPLTARREVPHCTCSCQRRDESQGDVAERNRQVQVITKAIRGIIPA